MIEVKDCLTLSRFRDNDSEQEKSVSEPERLARNVHRIRKATRDQDQNCV